MNPPVFAPAGEDLEDQPDKHALAINGPPLNTNEGSEFLDDSIRMKDMPLAFSLEKNDTGQTRNLI